MNQSATFCQKHTTIMYSCDLISDKLKVDNSLQDTINEIKLTLKTREALKCMII